MKTTHFLKEDPLLSQLSTLRSCFCWYLPWWPTSCPTVEWQTKIFSTFDGLYFINSNWIIPFAGENRRSVLQVPVREILLGWKKKRWEWDWNRDYLSRNETGFPIYYRVRTRNDWGFLGCAPYRRQWQRVVTYCLADEAIWIEYPQGQESTRRQKQHLETDTQNVNLQIVLIIRIKVFQIVTGG